MKLTSEESMALFGSLTVILPDDLETLVPGLSPESIANHLIQHGIGVYQSPSWVATAFNAAVTSGNSTFTLRVLLALGYEPTLEVIEIALSQHNSDAVNVLLEAKCLKITHDTIRLAVSSVCTLDAFERLLLACPLDPNYSLDILAGLLFSDSTPRSVDRSPILQFLLQKGAEPPNDVLHRAVACACKNSVRLLCAHGFGMNDDDGTGETPIFYAHKDMIPLCVELGSNLEYRNSSGETPLIRALVKWGKYRASPTIPEYRGMAKAGYDDFKALLDAGADVTVVYAKQHYDPPRLAIDNTGLSLLCVANRRYPGDKALIDRLLFLGACPLVTRKRPMNPHIVRDHVNYTLLYIMEEIAEINSSSDFDPRILAKMDTSSTMGDPRNPRSLPYHRLCEWVGLLRQFMGESFDMLDLLEKVEKTDLPNIARYVELSRAGRVQAERLCALDCGGYAEPAGKRHKK
jgi:hypothetical protein